MFDSNKEAEPSAVDASNHKTDTTIIGISSEFNGNMSSHGILRVDGSFEGELTVEGSIIVGESGKIKGNIKADRMTVAGRVEGIVQCSGALDLTPSGKLYGDIEVKAVTIQEGATFEGKCIMMQSPEKPQPGPELDAPSSELHLAEREQE